MTQGSTRGPLQLLHPELVHAGKGVGLLALERVPAGEIGPRFVVRETPQIFLRRGVIEVEADKREPVLRDERGDLRDRQTVLLHVEQEVAAAAGAEKIARRGDAGKPPVL